MVPLRPYLLGGCAALALIAAAVVACVSATLVSETALSESLRAADSPPADTLNIGGAADAAPAASRRGRAASAPPYAGPADAASQTPTRRDAGVPARRDPPVHTDSAVASNGTGGQLGDPPGPTQGGSGQQAPPAGHGASFGPGVDSPPGLAKKPAGLPPGLAKKPGGRPPGLAKKQGALPPGQAKKQG